MKEIRSSQCPQTLPDAKPHNICPQNYTETICLAILFQFEINTPVYVNKSFIEVSVQ